VGVGFGLAGLQGAVGGGVMLVVGIALFAFFVGAAFDVVGGKDNDAHLGGMPIVIGPIKAPPPDNAKDTWRLTMTPSAKLKVLDVHGAELVTYQSSHMQGHHPEAGHKYETSLQLDVSGGSVAGAAAPAKVMANA
jgi:hypothetical protein